MTAGEPRESPLEPGVIRLVPISADQIRVLESLQRVFFGLASDVNRDLGIDGDDSIAGGLYRLWSTLDVIATFWKEQAEDAAAIERWRTTLTRLANDAPVGEVRAIARDALKATTLVEDGSAGRGPWGGQWSWFGAR